MRFCGREIISLIVFSEVKIIISIIHACPYYFKANRPTGTTPLLLHSDSKLDISLRGNGIVKACLKTTTIFLSLERIPTHRIDRAIYLKIHKFLCSRGVSKRLTVSIIVRNRISCPYQRILNGNGCFLALGYFVKVSYTCLTQGLEQ